tara:strand:+ start:394 stop:759 length:366 start_codon:yes stop_codon:yes gene_type:complete
MNLKLIFRIFGVINFLRALLFLFLTERYLASAGVDISSEAFILAQALGVITFCMGLLSWRTPDIAGDALNAYAQLFGIVVGIYVVFLGYNVITAQIGGPTAHILLVLHMIISGLFFKYSKK